LQVEPFNNEDLNDLPRNLILSQEWRLNSRPIPSIPTPKKPIAHQPVPSTSIQMPKQLDKRKSNSSATNGHNTPTHSGGIAGLVNAFNKTIGGSGSRSSRSSSVASAQPMVSNLVKIYSEATAPKQRSSSALSTGKHDELPKIVQQPSNPSHQQQHTPLPPNIKQPSQAREEPYEEITWDNLVHG
jgi:hypothetical protein